MTRQVPADIEQDAFWSHRRLILSLIAIVGVAILIILAGYIGLKVFTTLWSTDLDIGIPSISWSLPPLGQFILLLASAFTASMIVRRSSRLWIQAIAFFAAVILWGWLLLIVLDYLASLDLDLEELTSNIEIDPSLARTFPTYAAVVFIIGVFAWLITKSKLAGVATALAILLLGPYGHSNGWWSSLGTTTVASHTISRNCNGEVRVAYLGQAPQVVNPGGRCIIKWRVDSGRVLLIDRYGRQIEVGPEGGDFPAFWTVKAKAADGYHGASMHYKLVSG